MLASSPKKNVPVEIKNAWSSDRRPPPSTCSSGRCPVESPHHGTYSSGRRQPPPHPGGLPIPARPELRQSPRAARPPRLLQLRPSRPPISAPASPARAPHLCAAPSLEPRPRRSRVGGGLQGAASLDQIEHGRLRVSKGEIRSRPSPTSSRGTASLTSFPFFPSAVFLIVREMDPVLSCGIVQRVCNCQLTAICSVHTIARMQNYL